MACTADEETHLKELAENGFKTATSPVQKLRYACLKRGANGIKGLGRYAHIFNFCLHDACMSETRVYKYPLQEARGNMF